MGPTLNLCQEPIPGLVVAGIRHAQYAARFRSCWRGNSRCLLQIMARSIDRHDCRIGIVMRRLHRTKSAREDQ